MKNERFDNFIDFTFNCYDFCIDKLLLLLLNPDKLALLLLFINKFLLLL